jgi:hypothetical protein
LRCQERTAANLGRTNVYHPNFAYRGDSPRQSVYCANKCERIATARGIPALFSNPAKLIQIARTAFIVDLR